MPSTESNLAVLFADVAGSTRLYEQVGVAVALATIGRCLALAESVARGHGGRLVKTIGDEAMLVFVSADHAVAAANDHRVAFTNQTPDVPGWIKNPLHQSPAYQADTKAGRVCCCIRLDRYEG